MVSTGQRPSLFNTNLIYRVSIGRRVLVIARLRSIAIDYLE
jgi:hypothetical protein